MPFLPRAPPRGLFLYRLSKNKDLSDPFFCAIEFNVPTNLSAQKQTLSFTLDVLITFITMPYAGTIREHSLG